MRLRHLTRLCVLLVLALVAALALPSLALAAVGGPYSQTISNPDDNGVVGPSGGSLELHSRILVTIPEGALPAPTPITGTVWDVSGGPKNSDNSEMRTLVELKPNGTTFAVPVTLSFEIPAGIVPSTAKIYGWNSDTEKWESKVSSPTVPRSGDKLTTDIGHFSWYGIGGTPVATTSTPASSSWSLALAGVAALGVGLIVRRHKAALQA